MFAPFTAPCCSFQAVRHIGQINQLMQEEKRRAEMKRQQGMRGCDSPVIKKEMKPHCEEAFADMISGRAWMYFAVVL